LNANDVTSRHHDLKTLLASYFTGKGMMLTAELLATLGNLAGLVLLNLGSPGLLLGLEFEPADVLAGLADALTGSHQSMVGLTLGRLGVHDALAGLNDAGVELGDGAVAKGPVKNTAVATAGIRRPAEDTTTSIGRRALSRDGVAGAARGRGRWGAVAAKKTTALGAFLVNRLLDGGGFGFSVTAEKTVLLGTLLISLLRNRRGLLDGLGMA
jgi:hypothetical protein